MLVQEEELAVSGSRVTLRGVAYEVDCFVRGYHAKDHRFLHGPHLHHHLYPQRWSVPQGHAHPRRASHRPRDERALRGGVYARMYVLPPLSLSHMAHLGAKVIENLTQKANNFKRFRTFVDMLLAAVREEERRKGTLLLDLLTEEDLATFKARETSTPSLELANYVHPSLQARRFLLLTYAAPYDRFPFTRHARES